MALQRTSFWFCLSVCFLPHQRCLGRLGPTGSESLARFPTPGWPPFLPRTVLLSSLVRVCVRVWVHSGAFHIEDEEARTWDGVSRWRGWASVSPAATGLRRLPKCRLLASSYFGFSALGPDSPSGATSGAHRLSRVAPGTDSCAVRAPSPGSRAPAGPSFLTLRRARAAAHSARKHHPVGKPDAVLDV